MSIKTLVINPGSTSTKVGVFEDETLLFEETLRHPTEEIAKYASVIDQKDFRKEIILDFLKEKNVTCVVGPLDMAADKLETWYTRFETPGLMEKAGINICLTQDSRSATRFLPYHVGMAIARGLSFETALRGITINPAKLLGIDDQVGSIEVGKCADLAIFDGNPFSSLTLCETTIIDGVVYNRSTEYTR